MEDCLENCSHKAQRKCVKYKAREDLEKNIEFADLRTAIKTKEHGKLALCDPNSLFPPR